MKPTLAIITLLILSTLTFGQYPQKIEGTYIQDHAQVLTPEQESALDSKVKTLKASKDIEIGIVTVGTTDGVAPVDYATGIGRAYGIGSAEGEHRGIVVLLAINDRQAWIEPSRHLEGVYTDGTCGAIYRSMKPFLKQGNYDGALNFAADQLIALGPKVDAQQTQGVASDTKPNTTSGGSSGIGLIMLIGLGLILIVNGGIAIGTYVKNKREREEQERREALRRQKMEEERKEREAEQARIRAEEERKRKEHEAWLKTPEGIADTARKAELARQAEARRIEQERIQAAKEAEERRKYALWAASAEGIIELARRAEVERKRKIAEELARKKREAEEEEERKRRRKREEEEEEDRRRRRRSEESSSYSYSGSSSYGDSSSSSDSSSGFGGGSDFGGGGGGGSW